MASPNGPIKRVNDETTPLLAANGSTPVHDGLLTEEHPAGEPSIHGDEILDKPLPKLQIFLLCYARLVDPIAYFSIVPFINQMVFETGGFEEVEVGFISGVIESVFSLTQMCVMIAWSYAADRMGRKPVLVFSLIGVTIATALFGLSKDIWQMILFRSLAGVFSGSVVTIRAMLSENSTKKTQARAFSFFAITGNLGIVLGPLIGGGLSKVAEQYPSIFGKVQFFKDYPYALPGFAVGAIGFSAVLVTIFFLDETLDRKALQDTKKNPPMTTWQLLKTPGVAIVVYIYSHIMLLAFAYTAVVPLFWFTSPKEGGLGFSPFIISMFMMGAGVSQVLWTLIVFPPLQHRIGTGGILRLCAYVWPIGFALWPICNLFLRWHWDVGFWILAPVTLTTGAGCSMAFTATQLALNDMAPTYATLGTLNAIALTVVSATRAVAPALFSSVFAAVAKSQALYGYAAWLIMVIMALMFTVAIRWLPEKAEGRLKQPQQSE